MAFIAAIVGTRTGVLTKWNVVPGTSTVGYWCGMMSPTRPSTLSWKPDTSLPVMSMKRIRRWSTATSGAPLGPGAKQRKVIGCRSLSVTVWSRRIAGAGMPHLLTSTHGGSLPRGLTLACWLRPRTVRGTCSVECAAPRGPQMGRPVFPVYLPRLILVVGGPLQGVLCLLLVPDLNHFKLLVDLC